MNDDGFPSPAPLASASGARRGWRCPDEAVLASWAGGTLAEATRGKLEGHVADCAYCRGQLGFLARAADLGPPPAVPAHLLAAARGERALPLGRLRPATALAAGAGLVLALLVAAPWPGGGPSGPGPVRDVRSAPAPDGAPHLLHPSEGQSLPRAALELRWRAAPGALFYTVQVVDADGDVAWEGRTDATRLAVPAAAPLSPDRSYFAWVFAHLPSGATVSSAAVGFRLAPG